MITLYDVGLSGNCHKVRLLLNLLDLPHQLRPLDLAAGEQRSPDYLALNPFGKVPVLVDGEVTLRDSQAILVYLAKRYGGVDWWPEDAGQLGQIVAWLSTAANEIAQGPNNLRLHQKFGRAINLENARSTSDATLHIIETHLAERTWLVGETVSIADIAIYPYLALAPEGGVDLTEYPNIRRWFADIRKQPGYVGMPGMWPA